MFKTYDKIFAPGEWMWADSAYMPKTWSVTPFKKPINRQLTVDQKTYNYWVSKVHYSTAFSSMNLTIYRYISESSTLSTVDRCPSNQK